MALRIDALSSDAIAMPVLETTLKGHTSMDTHHLDFIIKETISEPSLNIFTRASEDHDEDSSPLHGKGLPGRNILDRAINPAVKADTDTKGKSEDTHFSFFTQCLELDREEDKGSHFCHYCLEQGSSSLKFTLETLAFPYNFIESASASDHISETEKAV